MARLYIKTAWSYETDSWFDVTSVNFKSKQKSTKMKFSEDKIYYNFSQNNPKITNM